MSGADLGFGGDLRPATGDSGIHLAARDAVCWRPGAAEIHMPCELDHRIAEHLVSGAISSVNPPRGNKVVCTRRALHTALLAVAREAHDIGFLAGQKECFGELTRPGSPDRPAWMDIRLDDPADLAKHHIRIKPVVLRSLIGAGYRCLGDLRWVPDRQLREIHYVGIQTARAILAIVRRFERDAESSTRRAGPPSGDRAGTDRLLFA